MSAGGLGTSIRKERNTKVKEMDRVLEDYIKDTGALVPIPNPNFDPAQYRLFPYWPEDKAAAFRDLRARGAFLVSAERIPGKRLHAQIHSLRGNPCRLRWNGEDLPKISLNGEPVKFTTQGHDLLFDTEVGAVYEIEGGET